MHEDPVEETAEVKRINRRKFKPNMVTVANSDVNRPINSKEMNVTQPRDYFAGAPSPLRRPTFRLPTFTQKQEVDHIPSLLEMKYMKDPRSKFHEKHENSKKSKIDYKKLEEWTKMDELKVLKELIGCKGQFEEFLEGEPPLNRVILMVKVLAKLCLVPSVKNKAEIMNLVSKEKFIGYLEVFVMKLPLQNAEDRYFCDNMEDFFINLSNVLDSIIDTIPIRACEVLPHLLKALSIYIPTFENEQSVIFSEQVKTKLSTITEKLELNKTKFERKRNVQKNTMDEEDPPDDFRSLSVYPSGAEIVSPQKPFVRKHIIEGSYDSVEHYLDVQFRLLKEDFIAPLREGVCDYLNQRKSGIRSKLSKIRIHSRAMFVSEIYHGYQVRVVVKFPVKKEAKVDFENSKRFMYGSLICFTKDNFATFLFGKVMNRDLQQKKITLTVTFDAEYSHYKFHVPYIMIECCVFFEPYYHVLKALQNMSNENFPMKDYLIDVIPSVELPTYLNENSSFTIANQTTLLTVGETWPSSDELNLDNTQYLAYKAALTQKFAIIQGPPGTGKTYLGFRIVQTLLDNKRYWYNNTPILVVCFTNHALDQFLEGLTNQTDKIVRVGGQSKNDKLQKFLLKNIKNEESNRYTEDAELMKQRLIIGMTTTGAARLQPTLQALKCQIVIVEEAAEVLESHITASLTKYCQHLILIGDHQQLRPSTASYNMGKHYNLDISMFERMVRNKVQCNVLGVQHRMRPEIAKLISPNIYPTLKNHERVYTFPPVLGIDSSLYFIDHEEREFECGDSSKANQHEAKYLIRLACYLLQNGYEPEDITILAAYSGQLFTLKNERKTAYDTLLKGVKITTLDNYQGEECKIILLSLVRNNTEGSVGFLKIENRVCVALSRAKEGLYIMGNMNLLTQNSQIWPKINTTLQEQNAIGEFLTLRCQIHPEETINARKPEDFDKAPEGGCSRNCDELLSCQHSRCTKICHILDRVHKKTRCIYPCLKLCKRNHPCPRRCFETCKCMVNLKQTLRCGHEHDLACHVDLSEVKCSTPTPVEAKLPCGHEVKNKPCYIDIADFGCPQPCNSRIEPCGHLCVRNCHIEDDPDHLEYKCSKPCARVRNGCSTKEHMCPQACYEDCPPCCILIKKKRVDCSHISNVQCNKTVEEVPCLKPCKKILECGHHCKKKCFKVCEGCIVMVSKEIGTCGHTVQAKCSEEPDRTSCNGNCPIMLSCGHPCKNKCKEECTLICEELVDHSKTVDCGHKFKIPCHLANQVVTSNSYKLLQYCKEPCVSVLECKHTCSGTCGACVQGRVHAMCWEKCGTSLMCGHESLVPGSETCQPCEMPCMFKCQHRRCKRKCGEPCTPCKKRCSRRCKHISCKAKCGAICSVPPCNKPCNKLLPCKHPCVGFCGDPCPPLCRICNKEELTEILLGYEDEIDARFVLLDECKHVIESKGMNEFCKFVINEPENSVEVQHKKCPKCNTPLSSTQRYSDYIKQINRDVVKIKQKSSFGSFQDNFRKGKILFLLRKVAFLISRMNDQLPSTRYPLHLQKH